MNPVDPRWLEILKASGWQLGAVSTALGLFWMLLKFEWLPNIDSPLIIYGLPLAILLTGALGLFSFMEFLAKKISGGLQKRKANKNEETVRKNEQEVFAAYIPFMTEIEKSIFGYLLQFNQKTVMASIDGDLAASLIGRRFIRMTVHQNQAVSQIYVPFSVPDHLWEILEEHRDEFPQNFAENAKPPWHSNW